MAGVAKISVKTNGGTFAKDMLSYAEAVQRANVDALNWTAYNTREAMYVEFQTKLDRPTPKTMRSLIVKKATVQKPEAILQTKEGGNKEVPPGRWLDALVEGGSRRMKASELKLGSYLTPSRYFDLDPYGNVPGGTMKKILSQLKLAGDQSATNSAASKRKRKREGYFLRDKIIFKRTTTVTGSGKNKSTSSSILPQLILVDNTPGYTPRIDWDGVSERTFEKDYDRLFARALGSAGV